MSVIRIGRTDLARIRFVTSPLWETVASWRVLRRPRRSPHHRTWLPGATRAAARASFAEHARVLDELVQAQASVPGFLTARRATASPSFEEELAAVSATTPAVVAALRAWHDVAVAPHWPRMQTVLEADIAVRVSDAAEHGTGRMLESVHERLHWREDRLELDDGEDLDAGLGGRGLHLVPSVFLGSSPALAACPQSPPLLVYSARAADRLWETRRTPPTRARLAALLGSSRARVLVTLEAPATTTAIATRLTLAPAAVSAHLKVLHEAGLASRHRHGREVFYVLTDLGRRLLAENA